MNGPGYELIETSGDVGLRIHAPDMDGVLRQAALGLTSLLTDPANVASRETIELEVQAADRDELLVAWLNELIYLSDTRNFLVADVSISESSGVFCRATVSGEAFDESRHERRLLIKAATYHGLFVHDQNGGLLAEVLLDI